MEKQFDINTLLTIGKISNEFELELAHVADRKLRLLAKDNPEWKEKRKALRDLIIAYENENWTGDISDEKVIESDIAEEIAEQERIFIKERKELIQSKLKEFELNQQELGILLGHNSKSYMSELMNGLVPFSLKDLKVISHILEISMNDLIPTLSPKEYQRVFERSKTLNKPSLRKKFGEIAKT